MWETAGPGRKEYCNDCERIRHLYVQGTALYDYGSMADSVFRFKYGGRAEYAAFYGRDLYEKKAEWLAGIRPDALVPYGTFFQNAQPRI